MNANLTKACVLGCIAVSALMMAASAAATTSEESNPYGVISEKNVFRLNPPPPPAAAEAPKPPDVPKVMLSGFQKRGDRMMVYLAIPAKDPKDTAYLALQAGEKERDVEIIKIREDKQEVDILNTGTLMTLSIKSNGFALTGGAPAKPGPGPGPQGPAGRRITIPPGGLPPGAPTAGAPPPANADNAAIVAGGSGFNSGLPSYNGSSSSYGSSGAIVSGGNSQPVSAVAAAPNNPSAQIANTLFNGGNTGQGYRMPVPENVTPAPTVVQAAGLLIHQAAGGPPAPTGLEGPPEGGGPPGPEQ